MKVFISYKYTGKSFDELSKLIEPIVTILSKNHQVYCNYDKGEEYKLKKMTTKDIMKESFDNIKLNDIVIVLITEKEVSQGMILEIGYAKACNKKIIICCLMNLKQHFNSTLSIVDQVYEFKSNNDLIAHCCNIKELY